MDNPTCETCRFFDDTGQRNCDGELLELGNGFSEGSIIGNCHRYPPNIRFKSKAEIDVNAEYPNVWHNDWCGEHKERTDAP